MRRPYIGVLAAATLLLAGCGGGEGTDTTISSREAPAAEEEQTDQTPPPETTPERAPESTVPVTSPTTAPTGGGGGPYSYGNDTTTATTAGPTDATGSAEGQDRQALEAADSELGQILVGPDGMTLYVFLPDDQSTSTCYDSCAATWPPLEGEVQAGPGVDEGLVGTIERDDGNTQATYNGWPLYYYVSDSEPGDVTGQGVGDNWFVVDPAGEVVGG